DRRDFVGRGLRLALRRHRVRSDAALQCLPRGLGLCCLNVARKLVDAKVALRLFPSVALGAVLLEEGLDLLGEYGFIVLLGRSALRGSDSEDPKLEHRDGDEYQRKYG